MQSKRPIKTFLTRQQAREYMTSKYGPQVTAFAPVKNDRESVNDFDAIPRVQERPWQNSGNHRIKQTHITDPRQWAD